ncbi:hypothetical protein [Allokutzneria oryzae]|uniref:Tetracyclin repressor-like C-terminal domain-containing protein n=1 Tax=Allokutzneria oryzae TaxID=1378989 RepID=A0ABV5ZT02_9PSEU
MCSRYQRIAASLSGPTALAAVLGLPADLLAGSRQAAWFHEIFVASEQECVTAVLDRAVTRGELPRGANPRSGDRAAVLAVQEQTERSWTRPHCPQ